MPENEISNHIVQVIGLLSLILLLLGFQCVVALRSFSRLRRIEKRLDQVRSEAAVGGVDSLHHETSSSTAFEAFLAEDGTRRALPKAEQFAEFRKWRQKNGLNWTPS